eukprot:TRINITY_DN6008_c0_g1_i12.p2 TRINITY_DN6008_c0_g1~~TRINITY_DN6008_c0_g1_i12.p2  ORF type:complete len:242 (+),score=43.88 TRINITY_DN6008_c0_g1_i12:151-876(+)
MKLIAATALAFLCLAQARETIRRQRRRKAPEHHEVRGDVYVTFDDSDFFFENEPAKKKSTGCSGGSCKKQPRTQEFTFVDEDEWEEEEVEHHEVKKVPVKKVPVKEVPPKKHKRPTPQPKVKKIKWPIPKPAPKKIRKPKPSCGPSCEQAYESDCGPSCGPSCGSYTVPCEITCDPTPPRPTPRRRPRPQPRPVHEDYDNDRQEGSDREYWTSYELEDDAYLTAGRYQSNNVASTTADPRR